MPIVHPASGGCTPAPQNFLGETLGDENHAYAFSPRIRTLRAILAKLRPEPVREPLALPRATGTDDNLLRQVVYEGLREDKPATDVRRAVPHPKAAPAASPLQKRMNGSIGRNGSPG
jgi:hypothetical protein